MSQLSDEGFVFFKEGVFRFSELIEKTKRDKLDINYLATMMMSYTCGSFLFLYYSLHHNGQEGNFNEIAEDILSDCSKALKSDQYINLFEKLYETAMEMKEENEEE
jgi:hypothetical protein